MRSDVRIALPPASRTSLKTASVGVNASAFGAPRI